MSYKKILTPRSILAIIGVALIGVILHPRLANEYISPIRAYSLDSFIQKNVKEQNINRKDLWKFRDMHNIGKFVLDTQEIANNSLRGRISVIDFVPQLAYTSRFVESLGGQTQLSTFPENPYNFLIKTSSERLLETENEYILITLTPLSEEKAFNGFMNKIKLVEGKEYWLEVTKITK